MNESNDAGVDTQQTSTEQPSFNRGQFPPSRLWALPLETFGDGYRCRDAKGERVTMDGWPSDEEATQFVLMANNWEALCDRLETTERTPSEPFDRGPRPSTPGVWWSRGFKPNAKTATIHAPAEEGGFVVATVHDSRGHGPINLTAIVDRMARWDEACDEIARLRAELQSCRACHNRDTELRARAEQERDGLHTQMVAIASELGCEIGAPAVRAAERMVKRAQTAEAERDRAHTNAKETIAAMHRDGVALIDKLIACTELVQSWRNLKTAACRELAWQLATALGMDYEALNAHTPVDGEPHSPATGTTLGTATPETSITLDDGTVLVFEGEITRGALNRFAAIDPQPHSPVQSPSNIAGAEVLETPRPPASQRRKEG